MKKYYLTKDLNTLTNIPEETLQKILNKYCLMLFDIFYAKENCEIDVGFGILKFNFDAGFTYSFELNKDITLVHNKDNVKRELSLNLKNIISDKFKDIFT